MHSVLFVIEKPLSMTAQQSLAWQHLGRRLADSSGTAAGTRVLSENALMLDLSNGLETLAVLVELAAGNSFEHRALFFEEAPQWVCSG
jgi:hypothetical protein